jgi:hypothetical protein
VLVGVGGNGRGLILGDNCVVYCEAIEFEGHPGKSSSVGKCKDGVEPRVEPTDTDCKALAK